MNKILEKDQAIEQINNTRVYGKKTDIDEKNVISFWTKRAKVESINSVLLGTDLQKEFNILRNQKELDLLKSILPKKKFNILDVGCGMVRWAKNLFPEYVNTYTGIDLTEDFIKRCKKDFKDNSLLSFYQMSATDIDTSKLRNDYDLVLVTGVCMYINDDLLNNVLLALEKVISKDALIYIQESVSTSDTRLTLKEFYSESLESNYSAIYRTIPEYESVFAKYKYLRNIHTKDYLLSKELGWKRTETNAYYWLMSGEE